MDTININSIFEIDNDDSFNEIALKIFQYQAENCYTYRKYLEHLNVNPFRVNHYLQIPFLPIEFFKTSKIYSGNRPPEIVFTSSGTTAATTSSHFVCDLEIYQKSYTKGFEHFYGSIEDYCVLGLLPAYLERKGSSLIYMVNDLIKKSNNKKSGFYLNNYTELKQTLEELEATNQKTLLIGVSFALLDFVEQYTVSLKNTIVMETGGMKGRREEITRYELHNQLSKGFGIENIHSEYGMTELFSQAYSKGKGIFETPPWMKVFIRDINDPFSLKTNKSGGVNIIDLANVYSCSFIETKDLGLKNNENFFEILGRFDNSDIRGCNLMIE